MTDSDEIAKWALLAVGAWALWEVLKNKGQNLNVHRCGNCRGVIRPQDHQCPWCRRRVKW